MLPTSKFTEHFSPEQVSYHPSEALAKVDAIVKAHQDAVESRSGKGLGLGFEVGDLKISSEKLQDRSMSADSVPTLVSDSEDSMTDESMVITPEKSSWKIFNDKNENEDVKRKSRCVSVIYHDNPVSQQEKQKEESDDEESLDGHDLATFYRSQLSLKQNSPLNRKKPVNNKEDENDNNSIYSSFVAARRSNWLEKKATIQRSLSIQSTLKGNSKGPSTRTKPVKTVQEEVEEEDNDENLEWLLPLIQSATPVEKSKPPPIWAQFAKVKDYERDDESVQSRRVTSVLERPRPVTSSYSFGSGTVKTDKSRRISDKTSVVAMRKNKKRPDVRNLFNNQNADDKHEENEETEIIDGSPLPYPSSYDDLPFGPIPSLDRRSISSTSTFERLPTTRKDGARSTSPKSWIDSLRMSTPVDADTSASTIRLVGCYKGRNVDNNLSR